MIDREQLAEALGRLDPRHREVLDYSLRRRVPDEDLGEVFGGTASEVARLRAAAIEALSNDLGVQRGSDLGHMLKELLDPATWASVSPPAEGQAPRRGHRPVGVGPPAAVPVPADPDPEHPPVLDMLAGRESGAAEDRGRSRDRRGLGRRLAVGLFAAVALLVPAGVVAALIPGDDEGSGGAASSATQPFEAEREAIGDPFPTDPSSAYRYPVARVRGTTTLYEEPEGKVKVRVRATTEWDSPRVLSVVRRRGPWLAVLVPELKNGEVGWVRDDAVERLDTVSVSIHVDLSKRRMVVRRGGKDLRRFAIGVGRTDHPTPPGRFAVTDKLRVRDESSPYGCCVLALTGHQTKLPPGWPGGDRLAIHATRDTSGLGRAVSLGCMRTDPKDARWMLETVPLGTPVFVRA